ncbi:hypothetical protein [Ktedonospora formicarum]|uniref:Uncharacterized protein n=1 Tax=Ktedonospora formicarum TaxID=2778364 RepID=A0A8J3I9P9_9CHLR|nr:hypothetical protein [Ktedonospora formicarum]GHO50011.1 hypothetical protein KSX_81740 [Ktedonospora formicarum]
MGGFEPLLQAVKQQQQAMAELEEQNRELKRQLAELREGRGMYLDINGQRFALNVDELLAASSDSSPMPVVAIEPLVDVPATPLAEYQPVPEMEKAEKETKGEEEKVAQSVDPQKTPFLEEIMLKEFEAQTTSPLSVWNGPTKEKAQEPIDEEQKATLRRELSGSYILE